MRKVIVDVDTGVDDAHALMILLATPDVEIIAVTCVNGNVPLDSVCKNTARVLQVCGRPDIPIYRGASRSLLGNSNLAMCHGDCGLGDSDEGEKGDITQVKEEHAATALVRLVKAYPGEVTLLALAPLTNIALALRLDENFGKNLKEIVIMGGNIYGSSNFVNYSSAVAEFNFSVDPEAAYCVVNELSCPKRLVSWELCGVDEKSLQTWEWADGWLDTQTEKGRFVKAITKQSMERQKQSRAKGYHSCDGLAACVLSCPTSVITKKAQHHCNVEITGTYTRGQLVVDWINLLKKSPNVELILAVDVEKVGKLYTAAVTD